ncbi:hypothetical protein MICA_393 [Micavibrio aeruginosavorus ARL-13]|uniref:Uncharacterized protein n=1 Tax=Micavibrio aeruginosavorus (strain ARL-13) TaxID=856793 RepID=G2KS54_MICAA|nr:hypothetical protein MICA_393 [Micavibrio aeruginosavorus ARL-13]
MPTPRNGFPLSRECRDGRAFRTATPQFTVYAPASLRYASLHN